MTLYFLFLFPKLKNKDGTEEKQTLLLCIRFDAQPGKKSRLGNDIFGRALTCDRDHTAVRKTSETKRKRLKQLVWSLTWSRSLYHPLCKIFILRVTSNLSCQLNVV